MTIHWKAVEQYITDNFPLIVIVENLSVLDLAQSRVKGSRKRINHLKFIMPKVSPIQYGPVDLEL